MRHASAGYANDARSGMTQSPQLILRISVQNEVFVQATGPPW
jgi:hypothetical protein